MTARLCEGCGGNATTSLGGHCACRSCTAAVLAVAGADLRVDLGTTLAQVRVAQHPEWNATYLWLRGQA